MKNGKKDETKWVKEALNGSYSFGTGGSDKLGKRPGFSKKGSVTAKHEASMAKGAPKTHGTDGAC